MSSQAHATRVDVLLILLLAYGGATLFHHVHNAHFLNDYPNMPGSLSPAKVYAAWVGVNLAAARP